jgi:hypothetical protein
MPIAVLLVAAALNGRRIAAGEAALPAPTRACAGQSMADAVDRIAAAMSDARRTSTSNAKNEAMRELIRSAGVQWAIAMLLGLVFVGASRAMRSPCSARASRSLRGPPRAGRRACRGPSRAIISSTRRAPRCRSPRGPRRSCSRSRGRDHRHRDCARCACAHVAAGPALALRLPGFVLATASDAWCSLDLSANASCGQPLPRALLPGHLWLAMIVLCFVAMLRQSIGRALAWTLSMMDGIASGIGARIGPVASAVVLVALALALCVAFGTLLSNCDRSRRSSDVSGSSAAPRGSSSCAARRCRSALRERKLDRLARALRDAARVRDARRCRRDGHDARHGAAPDRGLRRGGVPRGVDRDVVAAALRQRSARASARPCCCSCAWIVGITAALFELGAIDEVTAGRLENLAAPLASANDQLALVTWFQRVAPPRASARRGAVVRYGGGASCAGVPAQIQSDYTFTALVGVFGWTARGRSRSGARGGCIG